MRPGNFEQAARAAQAPEIRRITSLPSSAGPHGAGGLVSYMASMRSSNTDTASVNSLITGAGQGRGILSGPLNSLSSFGAAQLNNPQAGPIVGSIGETRAQNASEQARSNMMNLVASMTAPTQGQPSVQSMITLTEPRPYDPVRAIEQSQHIRDDLRRQRREAAAVQTQNAVINNPLRAGQVFPDGNRAPWQDTVQRYPVPWFQAPQAGDLAEMPTDVPVI